MKIFKNKWKISIIFGHRFSFSVSWSSKSKHWAIFTIVFASHTLHLFPFANRRMKAGLEKIEVETWNNVEKLICYRCGGGRLFLYLKDLIGPPKEYVERC